MSLPRVLFFYFLLAPLAHAGKLSNIKSVSFDGETSKPGHFVYYGTTDAVMTGLFGWVAAAGGLGPDKEGSDMEARLRNAGFQLTNVFRSDFTREVTRRKIFNSLSGGNYSLRLDITRYGMGVAPTGFKRLKPALEASVTIRDSSSKQVYLLRKSVSNMDDFVRGHTYEEYRDNISWLVRDMRVLSTKLAERLAETMQEDRAASPPPRSSGGNAGRSAHRFSR